MTLVVENGQGLSTAESYTTETEATTYLTSYGTLGDWTGATTDEREIALRTATRYIDAQYAGRWLGQRKMLTQALDWPRFDAEDDDGYLIDSASVPAAVKQATIILAEIALTEELLPDIADPSAIKAKAVQADTVSVSVTYAGSKSLYKLYSMADALLRPLVTPYGWIERG